MVESYFITPQWFNRFDALCYKIRMSFVFYLNWMRLKLKWSFWLELNNLNILRMCFHTCMPGNDNIKKYICLNCTRYFYLLCECWKADHNPQLGRWSTYESLKEKQKQTIQKYYLRNTSYFEFQSWSLKFVNIPPISEYVT